VSEIACKMLLQRRDHHFPLADRLVHPTPAARKNTTCNACSACDSERETLDDLGLTNELAFFSVPFFIISLITRIV